MEVTVQHLGGVRFEAAARGNRVICDQPALQGGEAQGPPDSAPNVKEHPCSRVSAARTCACSLRDTGMTPPEFHLVSLGTCAAFYATQYLAARSIEHRGVEVKVSAEKGAQPARLTNFRIEVTVAGLDPSHQPGVLRAVKACLIHNTLLSVPAIETVVNVAECPINPPYPIDSEAVQTTGT